jgi:MYXO-CTERM domain-containing protein
VIAMLLIPWAVDSEGRLRVKKLFALALAAGAALFLRRQQQSRPAADVWREATTPPTGS